MFRVGSNNNSNNKGGSGWQSVVTTRISVVVVAVLLLLEWLLLAAYFNAHSAVHHSLPTDASSSSSSSSALSLSSAPSSMLSAGSASYSSPVLRGKLAPNPVFLRKRPDGGPLVGAFIPASNEIGPQALREECETWELTSSADPKVWGPAAWWTLHTMAAHYPERPDSAHREACEKFLWGLPYMLPCGECGFHLLHRLRTTSLAQSPRTAPSHLGPGPHIPELACASRSELVRTLGTIHNGVNQHNGKPVWTFSDITETYAKTPICVINNSTWESESSL